MSAQRRTTAREGNAATPAPAKSAPAPAAAKATPTPPRPKASPTAQPQPQSVVAGRGAAVRQLARDSWAEMKKVNWPDQETTRNLTVLVIGISVVLGLLLGGIDFVLFRLFEAV